MNLLSAAVVAVWRSKRTWLLQFGLNPVLLGLGVLWLTIPEARIWQLLLSTLLALVTVVGALLLHSVTLTYFADLHAYGEGSLNFRAARRRLLPFAAWAVLFAVCLYVVDDWSGNSYQYAAFLRSSLPMWLRNLITESGMDSCFEFFFWVVFWIGLPGLFLPLGVQVAPLGFHGMTGEGWRVWSHIVRKPWYWVVVVLGALIGVYLPEALLDWHPKPATLSGEIVSLAARLLVAWALSVTAWLTVVSAIGRAGLQEAKPAEGEQPPETPGEPGRPKPMTKITMPPPESPE